MAVDKTKFKTSLNSNKTLNEILALDESIENGKISENILPKQKQTTQQESQNNTEKIVSKNKNEKLSTLPVVGQKKSPRFLEQQNKINDKQNHKNNSNLKASVEVNKITNKKQSDNKKLLPIGNSSSSSSSSTASISSSDTSDISDSTSHSKQPITLKTNYEGDNQLLKIPEVLRKQGTPTLCSSNAENTCPCNTMEDLQQVSKKISYCDRKNWISVERMNELRKKAQDAIKHHKTFTIRGCFFSIRNALVARGWVEKLDIHRRHSMNSSLICQFNYEDLTNVLPKRRPGETRRQYLIKCERNIMSRFLEHMPIDFLWTARKEKCDWNDQAKNPSMIINKFHSVPFTSKEGLCAQLKDFHWFYEEGVSELYFPRCYNVWSPEELNEFIENFRLTGCIGFLKFIVEKYRKNDGNTTNTNSDIENKDGIKKNGKINDGYDEIFSENGKIPLSSIEFAFKRCNEYLDACNHNDIDLDETTTTTMTTAPRIWDHDWDAFLTNHYILTNENAKIQVESKSRLMESTIRAAETVLENIKKFWPQYNLDGFLNIWIVKPANKCRGRGIHIMNNIRKILNMVNPSISTKSRFVVQKYLERPLIIHGTKFDIRQWFLVTSVQPLTIWMYTESYLRFSSQEYNLRNYHESVHLTNHAVQKKYLNDTERDKRLPNENMWDCYSFQAYLRQIGKHEMWNERIYPGMKYAITGAMLASQENMDRRSNTFELFGADFMITEDFHPWLIEINSSPDLGATTSVTARMCPQCLEDIIKVVIDRRQDQKADTGNFEMIYRQCIPPAPAYMGLNLFIKGKQITSKNLTALRREKTMPSLSGIRHYNYLSTSNTYHSTSSLIENEKQKSPGIINFYDDTIFFPHKDYSQSQFGTDLKTNKTLIPTSLVTSTNSSKSPIFQSMPSRRISNSSWTKSFEKECRRPSDTSNIKTPQIISQRHLSCGPRITTTFYQDNEQSNNNDFTNEPNIMDKNIECVGNKYSLENLNLTTEFDKTSPRSGLSCRKQLCEMMYKSKSARLRKTEVKPLMNKNKSSPLLSTSKNNNNNKRQINTKRLKDSKKSTISNKLSENGYSNNYCIKNKQMKLTAMKNLSHHNQNSNNSNTNNDYYSSNFHTIGMSLRTWKSKQYHLWKDYENNSPNKIIPCKILPKSNLLANNNSQLTGVNKNGINLSGFSPKRQLCKNLSQKITENVGKKFIGQQ